MKLSIRKSLHYHKRDYPEQSQSEEFSIDSLQQAQSEVLNEEPSPYTIPIFLIPLIFSSLIFILMIQVHYQEKPQHNPSGAQATLKTLQENLAQSPILDATNTIQINHLHRHYQSCPYGYEIATMGVWDGVNSGCLCNDGTIKERAFCFTHFKSDCQSVPYFGKKKFQYWKGQMMCVQYAKNWRWVGNEECPDNFYKCGDGLCIHKKQSLQSGDICPLTDIIETPTQTEKSLIIGSKYFNKLRNGTTPLINFEIVPGVHPNSVCFNQRVQPKFQSGKYYPLAIVPEEGCDKYGDTFNYSKIIDSDFQLNVYDDNDFTGFETIPYFLDYIDSVDTYTLQSLSRITINQTNPQCNIVNPDSIKKMRLQGEIISSYTHYVCKISIILSLILGISSILFYVFRSCSFITVDFKNFQHIEYQLIISFIISMSNIALGIIYYTQADGLKGIDGQNRIFHEYEKYNCFTDQGITMAVSEVIKFAEHSYQQSEPLVKGCFYASVLYVLLITLLLFLQYKKIQQFFVKPWKDQQ